MEKLDPALPWWGQRKDLVNFTRCQAPYQNIYVGSDPRDGFTKTTAQSFSAIINVSDSPSTSVEEHPACLSGVRQHWIPINEMARWSYMVFYQFKLVMDYHYDKNETVYVHCAAGAHRSPVMVMCWLMSRGMSIRKAAWTVRPWCYITMPKSYKRNVVLGVIPAGLKRLYSSMKRHPKWGFMGHAFTKWHGKEIEKDCPEFRAPGYRKKHKKSKPNTGLLF